MMICLFRMLSWLSKLIGFISQNRNESTVSFSSMTILVLYPFDCYFSASLCKINLVLFFFHVYEAVDCTYFVLNTAEPVIDSPLNRLVKSTDWMFIRNIQVYILLCKFY